MDAGFERGSLDDFLKWYFEICVCVYVMFRNEFNNSLDQK